MANEQRGSQAIVEVGASFDTTGIQQGTQQAEQKLGAFARKVQDAVRKLGNVGAQANPLEAVSNKMKSSISQTAGALAALERRAGGTFRGTEAEATKASINIGKRLFDLEQQLEKLPAELKPAMQEAITSLRSLQGALDETTSAGRGAGAGFKGLTEQSKAANLFMLDFSRGAQDVQYGIRGFANNMDPIINNFVRMNTAAKEAGESLGSVLVQSLKSAGGVLVAVNLGLMLLEITGAADKLWQSLKSGQGPLMDSGKAIEEWAEKAKDAKTYVENLTDAIEDMSDAQLQSALIGAQVALGFKQPEDQLLPGFSRFELRGSAQTTTGGLTLRPQTPVTRYTQESTGITYSEEEYKRLVEFNRISRIKGEIEARNRAANAEANKEAADALQKLRDRLDKNNNKTKTLTDTTNDLLSVVKELNREGVLSAQTSGIESKLLQDIFKIEDTISNLKEKMSGAFTASPELLGLANEQLERMNVELDKAFRKYENISKELAKQDTLLKGVVTLGLSSKYAPERIPQLDFSPGQIGVVDALGDSADFVKKLQAIEAAGRATGDTIDQILNRQLRAARKEMEDLITTQGETAVGMAEVQQQILNLAAAYADTATKMGLASVGASILGDVFGELLDITKPFEERIKSMGDVLKGFVSQLIRAAAQALFFAAILSLLGPGATGGLSFGKLFTNSLFGSFGQSAPFVPTGGNKTSPTKGATFKIAADGQTMYAVLDSYQRERGLSL